LAHGQTNTDEPEPGEAERFVPSGAPSRAGADRFAGNAVAAKDDDEGDDFNFDRKTNPSKLTSVKGVDRTVSQPNPADVEDLPSDSTLPFRKPVQSVAEPAPLNDLVLEGAGDAPQPIQNDRSTDAARSYPVAANDTYWTIAKEAYGSGAYFKAIYEHNRRRLNNASALRPGMQLTLPDKATLERLYPTLCPRPQRVAAAATATRASATSRGNGREHVVSDGDTLYDVARRRLGNAKRWAEIYELNRDVIGAASDRLEPGTQLVLPE
jgi:nucleoid-associated protein YgaU